MHPALKKTILIAIVFTILLIGLPLAGRFLQKGIKSLNRRLEIEVESESKKESLLDDRSNRYLSLKEFTEGSENALPVQEVLENNIPYTEREQSVLAKNSPLLIGEPGLYGREGAAFFSGDEDRNTFTNLAVLYCAYNFGEEIFVREIEFEDLLYYDTVVLQYKITVRLSDKDGNSRELTLDAGHNLDESIFYITAQLPEPFDYEKVRDETETEWEDAYA